MKNPVRCINSKDVPVPCVHCTGAPTPGHTCVQCLCKRYFPLPVIQEHRAECIPRGLGIGSKNISRSNREYLITHMFLYMIAIKTVADLADDRGNNIFIINMYFSLYRGGIAV